MVLYSSGTYNSVLYYSVVYSNGLGCSI